MYWLAGKEGQAEVLSLAGGETLQKCKNNDSPDLNCNGIGIVKDEHKGAVFPRPISPVQPLVDLSGIHPVVLIHEIMPLGFEPGLVVDGE